jgi:hypothetical protein
MKFFFGFLLVGLSTISTSSLGQASVVVGSVSNSKTSYTPGQGRNRMLVATATNWTSDNVRSVVSITWGGQPMTFAVGQTNSDDFRSEIWYLNEVGISCAAAISNDFVVTWSGPITPDRESFSVLTLQNVDQVTPVAATGTGVDLTTLNNTVTLSPTAAGINDILVYATAIRAGTSHTPAAGYTEHSDFVVGGSPSGRAVASKQITVAGVEMPTAAWGVNAQMLIAGAVFNGGAPFTYYSLASGAWESNTSWSLSSDGSSGAVGVGVYPRRSDNVVIRTGHNITINSVTDNGLCGLSPDNLSRPNVGPFPKSSNIMFYQTGDILINGTLTVTGIEMMIEGYTKIVSGGTFTLASDLVNLGYLEADAGSNFSTLDDISLAGNSTTIINTNSISSDDLNISFTNATLCGTGSTTLTNGLGSTVTYFNGATVAQICTTFTINCTGIGCSGFPVSGTGNFATGNMGPGGVGDSNNNSLWLRANSGTSTTANGTAVSSWNDQSGNANHAIQASANLQPLFQSTVINNQPTILFDNVTGANSDVLTIPDNDNLDNTNGLSILAVTRPLSLDNSPRAILSKRVGFSINHAYALLFGGGNMLNVDIDQGDNRFPSALSFANGTNYITSLFYDGTLAAALRARLFVNGNLDITANEASATIPNYASDLSIGLLDAADGRPFGGHIAEIVIYNRTLNEAERIITDNYLSAKYDITLTSNDVYVMDNLSNGDYDFNVAGIGQASDGSNHRDAKGSGVVRMWNPNNLGNGEFLIWGHNNLNFSGGNTDVDGVIIQERISRVWRLSEVGDVGTVSISVDLSGTLGSALGNNLRLLIDRDGDGFADNDVTPVAGSFSGTVVTFSGINFQNGDRFTIGNTNLANPLPIELISFNATVQQSEVKLQWATASELNNDFFTIQRSQDAENWEDVVEIKGAGNSQVRLDYETIDGLPHSGISYYRLKQTDFDGKFTYSELKKIEYTDIKPQFRIYPNPVVDSKFNFELTGADPDTEVPVRIVNLQGVIVFERSYKTDKSGRVKTRVELNQLSSGMYVVIVNAATGLRKKILIQ